MRRKDVLSSAVTALLTFSTAAGLSAVAEAQLQPDEVAVVAMARSDPSRRLAEYYVQARGIPKSHVLLLDGEPARHVSRAVWRHEIRPAIRAWLVRNDLHAKVRCFVTCWDVPLKIGRRDGKAPDVVARQALLSRSRADLVEKLDRRIETVRSLASPQAPREPSAADRPPSEQEPRNEARVDALAAEFHLAFNEARGRLQAVAPEQERERIGVELHKAWVVAEGVDGVLRLLAGHADDAHAEPSNATQVQWLQGQSHGLRHGLEALDNMPDTPERDMQMLGLVRAIRGLLGGLTWIDQQREQIRKNETGSSFDSELSLLHWSDYPLDRWRPNMLHYRYDDALAPPPTTLMVSRLEAPTYEAARQLIDTALAVEKTGPKGKVYLDARGIEFDPATDKPGSYGQFDQSLRDLAKRLKEHTKLEVILDDEAKLFQPGDCGDAALYCGWYSLAKYIDAFDWRPGAVGYHMASSEATSLRKPGSKVWCSAMLEDGIAATLGPVHEPYLASFPLPDDFFSLLLTGKYTLVEAYYRTKPYNSWAMVLVGDPLYNPWKNAPLLGEDALPQRIRGR